MRIVYGIYNRIATFKFPDASNRNHHYSPSGSYNTNGLRINSDFWRSKSKSQLLYIYSENGSDVVNFDTLRRAFDSDSVIRASSRGAKRRSGRARLGGLRPFSSLSEV